MVTMSRVLALVLSLALIKLTALHDPLLIFGGVQISGNSTAVAHRNGLSHPKHYNILYNPVNR